MNTKDINKCMTSLKDNCVQSTNLSTFTLTAISFNFKHAAVARIATE